MSWRGVSHDSAGMIAVLAASYRYCAILTKSIETRRWPFDRRPFRTTIYFASQPLSQLILCRRPVQLFRKKAWLM